jgi:hypothetical protein
MSTFECSGSAVEAESRVWKPFGATVFATCADLPRILPVSSATFMCVYARVALETWAGSVELPPPLTTLKVGKGSASSTRERIDGQTTRC